MKKFLVVLLALAMILAIASTAMAADTKIPDYNDTKTSTEYANDIYRLTALGVLEGNTGWGGAYRPADKLTRAEFAKIACFMFGKQSQVNYYKAQPSAFSDVEEGFWAEGWINCANDNGLMIGIGGGKFAPQANVTKQEVATVVLRAVGYTDELPGAWPADYIAKSQKVYAPFASETLFDYVEIIDGTAATRAEMAAIVNYALDLYRVAPAGSQLIVNGISDADADGYLYKALKTNEANIYNFFLGIDIKDAKIEIPLAGENGPKVTLTVDPNLTTRETLLWDVFHAIEIPYIFERWGDECEYGYEGPRSQFVEAAGWGYEDFKKGELVFGDQITKMISQRTEPAALLPVATNYYIFDDCLDGELWQVGGRLANMTIQIDVSKVKIAKVRQGLLKGAEAVYVEMLSDVTYIDEETEIKDYDGKKVKVDNADVFSLDLDGFVGANLNGNYDIYDYDWFKHHEMGIVIKIGDGKVYVDDMCFGEENDKETINDIYCGLFCTLGDNCKGDHTQNYVFLKDGKLQDANCLELNDVLYFAGYVLDPDFDSRVKLYIVYTPKAATLDEMSNDKAHLIMSGDEYWYCDNEGNFGWKHAVSYDGGYTKGEYTSIVYADLKAQMKDDNNCLFAPGYGKKYVAAIIFAAPDAADIHFGVLTDLDADHFAGEPDDFFATGAYIYGVDGEKDEETNYDVSKKFNIGNTKDETYVGDKYLGFLGNFELNDKGQIKVVLKDGVLQTKDSGIGVPNGDDTGYVPFDPQDEAITMVTTAKGFLKNASVKAIDDLNAAIEDTWTDYEKHPAKNMQITESTIVYEVTATSETEGEGEEAETTWTFDEVKLGDAKDYIDAEFSANQFSIFAWDDDEIKVLYVVNPHFHGDVMMGVFDTDHSTKDGDFVKYVEDGTMVEVTDEAGYEKLTDHKLVYAIYQTKDGVADKVFCNGDALKVDDLEAGNFAVLVTCFGFQKDQNNPDDSYSIAKKDAKALIIEYTDGAERVTDRKQVNKEFLSDSDFEKHCDEDTEFIDLTGDGDFGLDSFLADANHAGGSDYSYIFVLDDANNVLKVFRCYKDSVESEPYTGTEATETGDGNDEFTTAWDWLLDLID